jgi:transcriptional regulator GlxA family with amidase domain
MKKLYKMLTLSVVVILAVSLVVYMRLQPFRELTSFVQYSGSQGFSHPVAPYERTRKTVVVMADTKLTEMFDMMAPFFLFNATEKANVYIVAEKKSPITMNKGPWVLPQFSFGEFDSLGMHADVIVLPFMNDAAGKEKVDWIKKHYSDSTILLAICDGAVTAAATGLYDGKPLTAHASDFDDIKKGFPKPLWVQQCSYTQSGNLFSTAGVSNAVEGSLAVINKLFGRETMLEVLNRINYYEQDLSKEHKSIVIDASDKKTALVKMLFHKNRNIGILLQDNISELELAGIFDTYNRSLPGFVKAYKTNGSPVRSKYGLTLIPTADFQKSNIDEMHVVDPESLTTTDSSALKNIEVIAYRHADGKYIINKALERIQNQYGNKFQVLVKRALDYN